MELSLFYLKVLVRRWGRIGTRRARSIKLVLEDAEAVWREVKEISLLRSRPEESPTFKVEY